MTTNNLSNNINKIMFLGPRGSYSEIAMNFFKSRFGIETEVEPVTTIKKIINEVDATPCALAVVPIENSIEGIVRETVDALLECENVQIMAQTVVPISHCLIAKGRIGDVKNIISHPQALSQCQNYISEKFGKDVVVISANSTSQATKSLLGFDESYASIGNEMCANMYGLNVLDRNINDVDDNKTRFVLLGRGALSGVCNRTSIAFSTKNEPGALLSVLEIFKKHNLNLVYLESRPSKVKIGDYVFFADIDRGLDEIKGAIDNVFEVCKFCKILGSYKNF